MAQQYNAPNTTASSIEGSGSSQMNTFFWQRKALVEAKKDMYFMPMADTVSMPKNYGKSVYTTTCHFWMIVTLTIKVLMRLAQQSLMVTCTVPLKT